MQFFDKLGAFIEQQWRNKNYDEAVFPEIAAQALKETPPHEHTNDLEIIHWLHATPALPRQIDIEANFGNPPITLYTAPRFYIDVYYWLDGTTTIHQHAFSGAFQVLSGSSIHSHYEFDKEQSVNQHLAIGKVNFREVELLQIGDTREIFSGDKFIHALFHLDRPSVTITVRTYQDVKEYPQYNYLKPYFAKNPFFREESLTRKLQSIELLLKMKHPDADKIIGEFLQSADFQTTFLTLQLVSHYLTRENKQILFNLSEGEERYQDLLERARRRHGQLVDFVQPVLDEIFRLNEIALRRQHITGSDHRFFLALLLNVPERAKVLELIEQRFPDQDVMATLKDWTLELANTKVFGSTEPNLLGIADFDEDYLFILQQMMRGKTKEQIQRTVREYFSADHAEDLEGDLDTIYKQLQSSVLFKGILTEALTDCSEEDALAAP